MPNSPTAPTRQFGRAELLAANLRYGVTSEPLRARAYAHVVAKVLLTEDEGNGLKLDRIRKGCRALLGSGLPSRDAIKLALDLLLKHGLVVRRGQSYALDGKARQELVSQITRRRAQVAACLRRHFPGDLDQEALRSWFEDVAVRFFGEYGDRWVAATARRRPIEPPRHVDLRSAVEEASQRHGLRSRLEDLSKGFIEFIRSGDPEDNELLWHYGRSMFSARLMAADLAADPISARELRGATLVLDTNILFCNQRL